VAVDFPPNRNEVCGNRHTECQKDRGCVCVCGPGIPGLKANILWVSFDGCSNKI